MDWVKLLTEFDGNPKVLTVGLAGAGLYCRALAYCGKYETDGFIPAIWVRNAVALEGFADLPKQMLDNGLWEKDGNGRDGYQIKDYLEVNRSRSDMESLRANRSAAGKAGGEAKSKQKESKPHSYSSSNSKEFKEWLEHYRETTGRKSVRGSRPANKAFDARRSEGRSMDDLKLATVGCHSDDFCRENGHDVPETILRAAKVERYIQLGRKGKKPGGSGFREGMFE